MFYGTTGGIPIEHLGRMIQEFQTIDRPKLQKRIDYYNGKQDILKKLPYDDGRECHKVVKNFCAEIVNNYTGYGVGLPVAYQSEDDIQRLIDCLEYNDVNTEDTELYKNGLISGLGVEILYIDEYAQPRFKAIDCRTCFPVYSSDLEQKLLYAVRIWEERLEANPTPTYYVEVWDDKTCKLYTSSQGWASFNLIEEVSHYFNDVPFVFYDLGKSVFEDIISLQDAYNDLLSCSLDGYSDYVNCYLLLKGVLADTEDLQAMKQSRCLCIDESADATFLTKDSPTNEVELLLKTVEDSIREIAACPNFNDESFGTSSGIALKWKLLALENRTAEFLNIFKKALQRRVEVLTNVIALVFEDVWRDISIIFTRNTPLDLTDTANAVNALRGLVSQETLLSILPFVDDPAEELIKVRDEQSSMIDLYAGGLDED